MEDNLILTADTCCDTNPNCDCGMPMPKCDCGTPNLCTCDEPKEMTVIPEEETKDMEFVKLAAVLQDSVLYSWKLHLKAKKYSVHVILEEYYNEAFDIIDDLIEHYQGICKCDIVCDNITPDIIKSEDPVVYFTVLKDYLLKFTNNSNNLINFCQNF